MVFFARRDFFQDLYNLTEYTYLLPVARIGFVKRTTWKTAVAVHFHQLYP